MARNIIMLNAIKTLIKTGLAQVGYSISRTNHGKAKDRQFRKIVNAYYKGQCFKCFLGDCISDFILTGRGWDNQLEEILNKIVSTHKEFMGNVIEIGANIG